MAEALKVGFLQSAAALGLPTQSKTEAGYKPWRKQAKLLQHTAVAPQNSFLHPGMAAQTFEP